MTTNRIRSVVALATLAVLALTALPRGASAQPWLPEDGDTPFGGKPGMHLFLPSGFLESIRESRLTMARTRYFQAAYRKAVKIITRNFNFGNGGSKGCSYRNGKAAMIV